MGAERTSQLARLPVRRAELARESFRTNSSSTNTRTSPGDVAVRRGGRMRIPPRLQRKNHRLERASARRDAVLHPRRHFGEHFADQKSVALQLAKLIGQHALGDVRQSAPDFVEAKRALEQMIEDHPL